MGLSLRWGKPAHVIEREFWPYELAELQVLERLAPSVDRAMDKRLRILALTLMAVNSMDVGYQNQLLARAEGLEAELNGQELMQYGIDDS